jgi:hypothetical protein
MGTISSGSTSTGSYPSLALVTAWTKQRCSRDYEVQEMRG